MYWIGYARYNILDGVIGNTSVFDTEIAGSSPAPITNKMLILA